MAQCLCLAYVVPNKIIPCIVTSLCPSLRRRISVPALQCCQESSSERSEGRSASDVWHDVARWKAPSRHQDPGPVPSVSFLCSLPVCFRSLSWPAGKPIAV